MEIRFAGAADAQDLLGLYGQYIDTPITFECALPSRAEFARRIEGIGRAYPYLLCREGERTVGYAYAHRQMEREAYQWNAELSVYLDRAFTSRGLGGRLYRVLMELLRLQGVRTAYGCVTLPNEKSEGLHRALGFRQLGVYRNTGYKCGAWHDVAWFEKALGPYGGAPEPVRPFPAVPEEAVRAVLAAF
ncbi:GNAT family N-acetyltransferase [Flavonifractor sp. DFI.6.63]|uniref:N-acetyltransferase n=1 Tax=Lawsonibacter hominis TaxID=2763053 RepID=A0A8J6JDJ9_9FIRM|nr:MULTISPECIES: GNAT family N-acetyltransferase [Oscillospiraceae]MBS1385163.1 N-acetyltransferase [Flavonifractor sp.]MDU2196713.1 GNAT family N-acetyltransferase [Clostridiales bacterium]MDY2976374.1 N-acetyltransferase family protein [Oscillospiraceae bacterium]MBC5733269.1 N-acetyltransferase [Lawsonibacter hominis]MCI6399951.1 N-acetyltransferase family protein [Lawsonibacter sp.]